MAESWASLLNRLKQAYAAAGLDGGDGLKPPARRSEVLKVTSQLGIPVPPSLRAVWLVHGGQRSISPGTTGLFGKHRLHSPAEVVEEYRFFCKNLEVLDRSAPFPPKNGEGGYFHLRLLPFASWDQYNLCIDTASGEVRDFSPTYGIEQDGGRPNLRALVRELLDLLAAGEPPEPDFIYGPKPVEGPATSDPP